MCFPESRVRVYLYGQAVDMRKSFDGLSAIAPAAFTQDPTAGKQIARVLAISPRTVEGHREKLIHKFKLQ